MPAVTGVSNAASSAETEMADRFVSRRVRPGQCIDPLSVMFVRELLECRSAEIKMQAMKRTWEKETGIVVKIQCAHTTLGMVAGIGSESPNNPQSHCRLLATSRGLLKVFAVTAYLSRGLR
jgi:hypothetical protein